MNSDVTENVEEANDNSTDAEYVPEEEDPEHDDGQETVPRGYAIWKFFKRMSPTSGKRARCILCLEVRSFRTSITNLKTHLKRHPKAYAKFLKLQKQNERPKRNSNANEETDFEDTGRKPRYRDSTVWKYFEIMSESDKMAKCNFCNQVRSYKTTVTNLKKHLSMKHPEVTEQDVSLVRKIFPRDIRREKLGRPSTCHVWNYFTKVPPFDDKMARCNYCHKDRSYRTSVSNLKFHLATIHPEVVEHDEMFAGKNYLLDDSDSEKARIKIRNITRTSDMSKLFKIDSGTKVATCRLCNKDVHFSTTFATLKYHIITVHGDDSAKGPLDETDIKEDGTDEDEEIMGQNPEWGKKRGTRRRSNNWNYFKMIDKANKLARCKICRKNLKFSTISNLSKHLIKVHSNVAAEAGLGISSGRRRRQYTGRSHSWKYFELVDEAVKVAKCNVCSKHLNFTNISNLKKHLQTAHPDVATTAYRSSPVKRKPESKDSKPQKQFRSGVWKLFDVYDNKAKIATCTLCNNRFAFGCVSNLKKHLQRKHDYNPYDALSSDEEAETEIFDGENSQVWAYYKCLSQDLRIASCLICKKRLNYSDENDLNKHLTKKHPQVDVEVGEKPKKLMITGDGDIYEIDETVAKTEPAAVDEEGDSDEGPYNNDETDALGTSEYLDENIFDEPNGAPEKKKHLLYQRNLNTQEHSIHTNNQRQPEEDSLDIFGRYMVSLLKSLPKHKSDKLQVDFITLIMQAKNDTGNTCSNTHFKPIQITRTGIGEQHVSSNSDVQVITDNGEIQNLVLGNEQMIGTSARTETPVDMTD